MGIEYYLAGACKIKERYGDDAVIETAKAIGLIDTVRASLGPNVSETEFSTMVIKKAIVRPDGVQDTSISIAQMQKQVSKMTRSTKYCSGCGHNIHEKALGRKTPYGCYGTIHYPISDLAEKWIGLAAKAILDQDVLKTHGLILRYIIDHPSIGERFEDIRASPSRESFLMTDQPFEFQAGDLGPFTTDQLFEMLFGFDIAPNYARYMYEPFFVMTESVLRNIRPDIREQLENDRSVAEFRLFSTAIRLCDATDTTLRVSM